MIKLLYYYLLNLARRVIHAILELIAVILLVVIDCVAIAMDKVGTK